MMQLTTMRNEPLAETSIAEPPAKRWRDHRSKLVISIVMVVGWWIALRALFFEGLHGVDDLEHVIYALQWDHLPRSHWETRIFFNALLHASIRGFGESELAYALPSLLGSLLLLGATTFHSYRRWGTTGLVVAGMLVASLPLDVVHATVPTAHPLAVGFAAVGTAFLLGAPTWFSTGASAFCLALAILAHPAFVFFSFALCGPRAVFSDDNRQRLAALACATLSVAIYFTLEFAIYKVVTGDPFYEMKLLERLGPQQGVIDPEYPMFSPGWFFFPLWTFFFSRQFGIMIALGTIGVLIFRKRLPREELCLALSCLALWLWMGYGSFKPTGYLPFWRTVDYNYALAMPVCLCITSLAMLLPRGQVTLTVPLLGLHVLMLSCLGAWGQGIKISKDMLGYVKSMPAAQFITDRTTNRQLFALNGCRVLPNVSIYGSGNDQPPPRNAPLVFLWNPLNQSAEPAGLKLGKVEFATEQRLRTIANLLPTGFVAGRASLVRRPAGKAFHVISVD